MKRAWISLGGCLVFTFLVSAGVSAVWPPSTSLEESTASARQDRQMEEKIDRDIRRLEELLAELKRDREELRRSQAAQKEKEVTHDGHDLH